MKHFHKYIFFTLSIVIFSCDPSTEPATIDVGYDYFPMQKGLYQIYNVDEIVYTLRDPDTLTYQLKTVVVDSFANTEGTFTYVVHRSKRNDSSQPWTYIDTWSSRRVNNQGIESEENVDFVKLVFPFGVGTQWNGNVYNTLEAEDFEIVSEEPQTFNGETFSDCVEVKQRDNQDFIVMLDKRYDTYAKNIGLVYREITQLTYCSDTDLGCIGQQIVEDGVIYKQTIVAHGKE